MNVSLTTELEDFVTAKVESGRYTSASEVVREALRLMEERDQARNAPSIPFGRDLTDQKRVQASPRPPNGKRPLKQDTGRRRKVEA